MTWDERLHPRGHGGKFVGRGRMADVHVTAVTGEGHRVTGHDQVDEIAHDYGLPAFGEDGNIPELRPEYDLYSPHDPWLAYFGRRQGFDGHPRTGTAADLDAAVTGGGVEMWRGVKDYAGAPGPKAATFPSRTAGEIVDGFRSGDYEPGTGIYGNGYYFSTAERVGQHFAGDKGVTFRTVLHPDAKVIDYDDLDKQVQGLYERPMSPALTRSFLADPGRLATAMGYDAIRVVGKQDGAPVVKGEPVARHPESGGRFSANTQYIVLNRTALLMEAA